MFNKKLLFCVLSFFFVFNLNAKKTEEDISELELKRKQAEILLNSSKKKENEIVSGLNRIEDEEKEIKVEIDFVNKRRKEVSEKLQEKILEKQRLEEKIERRRPVVEKYLVYIYKRKNWDYSRIFFDSTTFNQFLKKYKVMKRIIKEELIFLDSVKTNLIELENVVKEIDSQKEELRIFSEELDKQQKKLSELKDEKNRLLERVRREKERLERRYKSIEKDYKELVEIIKRQEEKKESVVLFDDSKKRKEEVSESTDVTEDNQQQEPPVFRWPLSRKSLIALPFGQQYNEFNTLFNNQGIDIEIKKEDWVIASAPGRVAYKGKMSGLGNLIIMRHKAGYTTVYTYLEDIFVRIGQEVDAGEKLATCLVHADNPEKSVLHFEIRKNGETINPENILVVEE